MEYCYNPSDGFLCRYDRLQNLYEAYNWRDHCWEPDLEAYLMAYHAGEHLNLLMSEEAVFDLISASFCK